MFAASALVDVVVDLELPDGRHLRSRVLGLSYFDSASGKSVAIAEVVDSAGVIGNSNQVIYAGAFTGVKADLRYTYRRAGLEQDVILRERPPAPESFGLHPSTTRLQVVTEFLAPPVPVQKSVTLQTRSGRRVDQTLDFGSMRMVPGRAFLIGAELPAQHRTLVGKRWTEADGRTVLIEEVPLVELEEQLETLPAPKRTAWWRSHKSKRAVARTGLKLPQRPPPQPVARPMQFAKLQAPARGLVLDYVIVPSSVSDYTFKGDTTYLIADEIYAAGVTTIEGGTVIKYAGNAQSSIRADEFDFKTGPYRPALLTSLHDDSVGEILPGSSGTPQPGGQLYLYCANGVNLRYGHVRFAGVGTFDDGASDIWHSQFVSCGTAVLSLKPTLRNCLFTDCDNCVADGGGYDSELRLVEQVTANDCAYFVTGVTPNTPYEVRNSLFTVVPTLFAPSWGTPVVNYDPFPANEPTAVGVYEPRGAGAHYLSETGIGDSYRDAGTTGITPELLLDLAKKTTHATPLTSIINNQTVANGTVWTTTAPRDNDNLPDFGYHYDPLDCCVSRANLAGTAVVQQGTILGYYGSYGFRNGALETQGTPVNCCRLVHYSAVQEQPTAWGANASAGYFLFNTHPPELKARFTDFTFASGLRFCYTVANNLDVAHCRFLAVRSYWQAGSGTQHGFTNNIFERCNLDYRRCSGSGYEAKFWNNLFLNSSLAVGLGCNANFVTQLAAYNNLFANSSFTYSPASGQSPQIFDNGFYNSTATSQGTAPVSVLLLDFVAGPLGDYYYPTTGGNVSQLINAGNAASSTFGFDIYTTQANHAPDAGTVDIGFHYFHGLPTTGKDFWIAFCNAQTEFNENLLETALYITSPVTAAGLVSIPGLGAAYDQPFTVTPGVATKVVIPLDTLLTSYNAIQGKGVRVTSDQPVAVYGLYYLPKASTAFTAYPTPTLGTEYCLLSRFGLFSDDSQFAVVATEANTTITISPSATADLEGHPGTSPFTINLAQPGQTYQLRSGAGGSGDVTGTMLGSDKPVAVFAGDYLAKIGPTASNPLAQQQLPIPSWGTHVLGFPFLGRPAFQGDFYRVLAANSDTEVRINGTVAATLQAGQFYEETISGPVEFHASKPIQVAQFTHGGSVSGSVGDPCGILLFPAGNGPLAHIVATPSDLNQANPWFQSYLNVTVEKSGVSTTVLDGMTIPASDFQPVGLSGYYTAHLPVAVGIHTVSSSVPVAVQVYGFGEFDAYGYSGGAAVWPVRKFSE